MKLKNILHKINYNLRQEMRHTIIEKLNYEIIKDINNKTRNELNILNRLDVIGYNEIKRYYK